MVDVSESPKESKEKSPPPFFLGDSATSPNPTAMWGGHGNQEMMG